LKKGAHAPFSQIGHFLPVLRHFAPTPFFFRGGARNKIEKCTMVVKNERTGIRAQAIFQSSPFVHFRSPVKKKYSIIPVRRFCFALFALRLHFNHPRPFNFTRT
jgi:hypothetical protein